MKSQKLLPCHQHVAAHIRTFLQTLPHGDSSGLLLVGEVGVGKTTLIRSQLSQGIPSSTTIAHGIAFPTTQHLPFGLVTAILYSLLGMAFPCTTETGFQQIETLLAPRLGHQWEAVRPALHYLLHSPDTSTQARLLLLPPDQIKHQLFWAIRQLFKAFAQTGPLLLVVENFHWADEHSLDILSTLPSIKAPFSIRLLGSTWDEGWKRLSAAAQSHHTQDFWHSLVVEPLPTAETRTLIEALLPNVTAAYADDLTNHSQGNLLYIHAIVKDFGLGIRDQTTPLPRTIADIFLHRLRHLSGPTQTLIKIASVIGSPIDPQLLQHIAESLAFTGAEYQAQLSVAQEWKFLESIEHVLTFRTFLAEESIYRALESETRAQWHWLTAQAIESLWSISHPWRLTLLAHHYQHSAHPHQAIRYLLQAGQEAAQQYANREAIVLLSAAHQIAYERGVDIRTARQLRIALGNAFFAVGQYEDADRHYNEALLLTERLDNPPPLLHAEVYRLQGRIAEVRGDYTKALEWLKQAHAFLQERERNNAERLEKARICSDLGLVYHRQGLFKEAEEWLHSALALAMTAEDDALSAEILHRIGSLFFSRGDLDLAAHYLQQALDLRQSLDSKYTTARTMVNLGACYNAQGRWKKALQLSEESLQVLTEFGDFEGITAVCINLGQIWNHRGNFDKAGAYLDQAIDIATRINHTHFLALALITKTQLYLQKKDITKAKETATRIPETIPSLTCRKYHLLGEIALRKKQLQESQRWIEQSAQLLQTTNIRDSKMHRMYHHRLKGLLAAAEGKFHHALAELQMAIDLAPDDYEKAFFLTEAAELAHQVGDHEFATIFITQARPLAEMLEATPLLERLDAILGDVSSQTVA